MIKGTERDTREYSDFCTDLPSYCIRGFHVRCEVYRCRRSAVTSTYSTLPMATCPHCDTEQQIDDYYDLGVGDSRECQHCGSVMHIVERDTSVWIRLSTDEDRL